MKKSEEIIALLLSGSARIEAEKLAIEALNDQKILGLIIHIFLNESDRITQRASWVLELLAENSSHVLLPFEGDFLFALQKDNVRDAVKRNVMRIWSLTEVSKSNDGLIYDKCLSYLIGHQAIAIKVHAMSVAYSIAKPWPELCNELKVVVEDVLLKEGESAGIRSKCKRLLKELNK